MKTCNFPEKLWNRRNNAMERLKQTVFGKNTKFFRLHPDLTEEEKTVFVENRKKIIENELKTLKKALDSMLSPKTYYTKKNRAGTGKF